MPDFITTLRDQVLTADGAMGTLLFSRHPDAMACVEALNLTEPQVVEQAHREYLEAGARLIETNSYAANRVKLGAHGLHERLEAINGEAVRIARRAAGKNAFVAGSIGPLGAPLWPLGVIRPHEAHDIFAEHAAALAAAGPDLLLLETFGGVDELLIAVRAGRDAARGLPVVASLSVGEDRRTIEGEPLERAFARLEEAGVAAVGLNCSVGPHVIYEALGEIADRLRIPFSVMPNAGYPHRQDDRAVYGSTPAYFAGYAPRFAELGARIIGGCCGTTPAHIRAIASALADVQPARISAPSRKRYERDPSRQPGGLVPQIRATVFERKLGHRFVITVEISPPRGTDVTDAVRVAQQLEKAGADAAHISDNPTARLRMSGVALAHLVMRDTALATILHLGCRDRNLLGLQSELLGAAALGVNAILPLTGDPSNAGDFPKATSVFDVTALGLTQIVGALNRGEDLAGSAIGVPSRFRIGVAVNPRAKPLHAELERVESKLAAGADFAVTQPVFETDSLDAFLAWAQPRGLPVLAGVVLLRDDDNAEFLHNEVPGMHIPQAIRDRLRAAADQSLEAVTVAQELVRELVETPGVSGVYLLPQERYERAVSVVASAARAVDAAVTRGAGVQ